MACRIRISSRHSSEDRSRAETLLRALTAWRGAPPLGAAAEAAVLEGSSLDANLARAEKLKRFRAWDPASQVVARAAVSPPPPPSRARRGAVGRSRGGRSDSRVERSAAAASVRVGLWVWLRL